jgi:DNA polymerase-4
MLQNGVTLFVQTHPFVMNKSIVHMDLDTFFVSCERLRDSRLEGLPLIIGGGERGVVSSCSYEARKYGVRSAMPMKMALRLCPDAKVIKGDMSYYSDQSHAVTQVIADRAPLFEKASIDEFYLDITGLDRFFGCYRWTGELAQTITRETGLPISFAVSVNKTVSKIGTGEAKPRGKLNIAPEGVKPFLNPLPVRKIPMVGDVTFQLLSRIGIRRIQTLAEMPVEMLERLLGQNGRELWKKANGIDEHPVQPYRERKSISTEHTFHQDTMDLPAIRNLMVGMVEKLAFQLRREGWLTSSAGVRIRYNNFDTETRQVRIPYTANDHTLIRQVLELFDRHYNRRMRLRLVGVNFSGLVRGTYQTNLFEDTAEQLALYTAIDQMKKRFGFNAVRRCAGLGQRLNL